MTPRPRNRRAQIIAAAGPLFHRMGYQQVGMVQIASAVGLTSSALYRHFPGKQQLLTAVIAEYFTRLRQAVTDLETDRRPTLESTVRRLAATALDRREAPLLWARESGRVDEQGRDELRLLVRAVADTVSSSLLRTTGGLTPSGADILAWRAVAVLTSPSYHHYELPRPQFERTLADMTMAVLTLVPPTISEDDIAAACRPARPALGRLSRREALLFEALRLFSERGYHGVTVEDIGAAVGISGPSVYTHFAGKSELLRSLLTRGEEYLQLSLSQVLARSSEPAQALASLLHDYAAFAWDHGQLMTVLVSEAHNLPAGDYQQTSQNQREYLAEWYHLLRLAVPELDETQARIRIHAALTVVNHLARSKRAKLIPQLRWHVVRSALATLGLPGAQARPWISEVGAIRSSPR